MFKVKSDSPLPPPIFHLLKAYSWPTPLSTKIHKVLSWTWQRCKLKSDMWLERSPPLTVWSGWTVTTPKYKQCRRPVVSRGSEASLSCSFGRFGERVRLWALAVFAPRLSGALQGLCALLVNDHVIHALVRRCDARSHALHLNRQNVWQKLSNRFDFIQECEGWDWPF